MEVFEVSSKVRKMEEDVSGNQCYYKLIDLQFYNFSTRNHIQGFTDKSRVLFINLKFVFNERESLHNPHVLVSGIKETQLVKFLLITVNCRLSCCVCGLS